jgi:hypothetical protein
MVNAQEWLDQNYPPEGTCIRETADEWLIFGTGWNNINKKRSEIIKLNISDEELEGDLKLEGFINLRELGCFSNQITSLKIIGSPDLESLICSVNKIVELDVSNFSKLKTLYCYENLLTGLDLSQNKDLEYLKIDDNNFPAQDLSFLSHLVNLKGLQMGNIMSWEDLNPEIYNHFSGSLKPLKNLTQLETLNISNTNLDSGLEYLPFSLKSFSCPADKEKDVKVKTLEEELKEYGEVGESEEFIHLLNEWKKINLVSIISDARERIKELEEELQMERQEAKKALEKAKEWRERQLAEITGQKDQEIKKIKEKNTQLQEQLKELQLQGQIQVSPKRTSN